MSVNPGYLIPSVKKAVAENFFNFEGRTNRWDFWHFQLAYFIFSILLNIIIAIVPIVSIVSLIVSLALLLPSLGIAARRLHDIDKSGWFMLIPFYNIYLFAQPGTPGANRFGPAPAPGA